MGVISLQKANKSSNSDGTASGAGGTNAAERGLKSLPPIQFWTSRTEPTESDGSLRRNIAAARGECGLWIDQDARIQNPVRIHASLRGPP